MTEVNGVFDKGKTPLPSPFPLNGKTRSASDTGNNKERMNVNSVSRKKFLRGLGVSMALPWMESRPVRAKRTGVKGSSSQAPTRMAVLFSGCGYHRNEWWAKGNGADMELGKVLQPLNDFRDRLVFIRGLYNAEALKGNIHSSQTGNLLSGAPLAPGGTIRSGTSFDQMVAQKIGFRTKLPSLVLGCEKANPSVHKNYSMLYSSHISWSSPTTPTPLEVYPALAFDQLFKDSAQKGDRSVLDAVLTDAKDFRRNISRLDQQKLDEYLNSVREVEQRIDRAGQRGELQGWRPAVTKPSIPRPDDGFPQDIVEHMKLMSDILVLAFQTDTTRVCTLKLNNDHGTLRFPHLGVDYMIHHLLSHSDTEDWLKVNQFFLEQMAYIARRLGAIQEGERTALDNSMLMLCSSMMSGHHNADQLPVVLVGGGSGQLKGGRVLNYRENENRQMCRLFLSLMNKMGLNLDSFGDAREPLHEV